MKTAFTLLVALALPLTALRAQPAPRPLQLSDLSRLRDVADPQLSPDGAWVAYTVTRADSATDKRDADVWMARTDGSQNLRVTTAPAMLGRWWRCRRRSHGGGVRLRRLQFRSCGYGFRDGSFRDGRNRDRHGGRRRSRRSDNRFFHRHMRLR